MEYKSGDLDNPVTLKSMIYSRDSFACTIFQSILHGGRPIMIVAGSYEGSGRKTAEVFDFTKEGTSWQRSNFIFATSLYFFQTRSHECIKFF